MTRPTTRAGKPRRPQRDSEATRARLLAAATAEFSRHGFSGARVERIVVRARVNMRMVYHHFGSKKGLYVAVLESVYAEIRGREQELALDHLDPLRAIDRLVEFTLDHFASHPDFVSLTLGENLHKGKFIAGSRRIPGMSSPLVGQIRGVLARGAAQGVVRPGIDPVAFYVSIVALACHHLNNRYTLSATFGVDVGGEAWQRAYRRHAIDLIGAFVRTGVARPADAAA